MITEKQKQYGLAQLDFWDELTNMNDEWNFYPNVLDGTD